MELELAVSQRISYVMYQNRLDAVLTATAANGPDALDGVTFRISAEPAFMKPAEVRVDSMAPEDVVDLTRMKSFSVELDPDYISSVTERVPAKVTMLALDTEGNELASASADTMVLPFDDWPGCDMAETIVSFVTPNAASLAQVRAAASDILREWGLSSSLEGYQGDRDRVLAIGAAVYAALERANINYINPPAGFESRGQRVRIPDEVLSNHEGTCLDLAVLYASVLESIRINALVFFVAGHAFAGFWLVDDCMSDIISFESANVTRMIRNKDMRAVECTTFTNSSPRTFDEACDLALAHLDDADTFVCAVDVKRARTVITPLPTRRFIDGTWVVERPEARAVTQAPKSIGKVYEDPEDRPLTRVDRWKRDLLDITNRNNMINMKAGTKVAPLLLRDITSFEDRLAEGGEFTVLPKPQEWDGTALYGERPFETESYVGNYSVLASDELSRGRIRTPMTETELEKSMRSIYRLANRELEESGCNSLFLALGVLRWYEGRSTGVPHYAPLILVPAVLKRKQKGYAVAKIDEETIFNVTLMEKLRQEYEIEMPQMDPLPADDSGVNVEQILQVVRRSIDGREGWEVLEGAALGVFSFNQFVMWKDLDSNMDRFMSSDVVRCLVESKTYPAEKELNEDQDPYGLCLTVPADGSQIRAVKAVGDSRTFVMHGPPGTGKSQTITNMICNELYNGRTVLFVAEKRAALEVVQKRLVDVGIGNHCLELHSNKSEKSKVLEQLRAALEAARACDDGKLRELTDRIESLRSKLDAYVHDLHMPRPWGLSAYDCISRYESCDVDGAVDVRVSTESVSRMTPSQVSECETRVREACQAYRLVRDMDCDAMRRVGISKVTASIQEDLERTVASTRESASRYDEAKRAMVMVGLPFDVSDPKKLAEFYRALGSLDPRMCSDPGLTDLGARMSSLEEGVRAIVSSLRGWESRMDAATVESASVSLVSARSTADALTASGHLRPDSAIHQLIRGAGDLADTFGRVRADMDRVSSQWTSGVYDLDADWRIGPAWQEVGNAGFFGKGKARKEFMAHASPCLRDPGVKFESLSVTVNLVSSISADVRRMRAFASSLQSMQPLESELSALEMSRRMADSAMSFVRRNELDPVTFPDVYRRARDAKPLADAYVKASDEWTVSHKELEDFLETSEDLSDIEACRAFCDSIAPYSHRMFDWANWNHYAGILRGMGLDGAVDVLRQGLDEDLLVDSVNRSVYRTMINICRQDSESLRMFSAATFEGMISQFRQLDRAYTNLNRNLLRYRLYLNVPKNMDNSVAGTESSILYRAINSSRMRKSIRTLLSEIPNILPKICPCFLMSPQSVAQYITTDYPRFDTVIFDESSQITTCKAIGALGRANAAVIAGDSKQLPPTSFFQKRIESTDDDDDMIDIDSFLDDCLSLNMPETYLEWHYRSRHESLIAFSNRMFYDNKMLTFPSPNDQETRVSMRFVNGVYERGKSDNPDEARAVVDEIRRRVADGTGRSIGVVAFSVKQQSCIQDMLDDATSSDPAFFEALNGMSEELFVKNLETVQGDERDVILFSIGYGPDRNGTIYQNFGPINREGGGRRLNVAVSRARSEMVVFSSMRYTDVKLTPSSSSGVRYMREFLRFAENRGHFGTPDPDSLKSTESSILTDIANELSARGYRTHFDVGSSEFRVDVAVVDPDDPEEYILGILNDGDSYRSSGNTRDREYARADVLRGLGWNIMHVWSIEWFFQKAQTMDSIVRRLEELRSGREVPKEEPHEEIPEDYGLKDEPIASAPEPVQARTRRLPYRPYEPEPRVVDPDTAVRDPRYVRELASEIISNESPVTETNLIGIYCRAVGIKRLSAQKRAPLVDNLRSLFTPEVEGDFVTYWGDGEDRAGYDSFRVADDPEDARDISSVPLAELISACVETVEQSGSLTADNAPAAVGRTLGYSRAGANVRTTISKAMDAAVARGRLSGAGGRYTLPE